MQVQTLWTDCYLVCAATLTRVALWWVTSHVLHTWVSGSQAWESCFHFS